MNIGYKFSLKRDDSDKISIKHDDQDLDFENLTDLFIGFARACGYSEETIRKYIPEPQSSDT